MRSLYVRLVIGAIMNERIVACSEVLDVMATELAHLDGPYEVLSILSGGVFWEPLAEFEENRDEEHDVLRLLELRAYGPNGEFRAVRGDIDPETPFRCRTVTDDGKKDGEDYLDDVQRLDIDSARSRGLPSGQVYATGGGMYRLPSADAKRIRLRNYLEYGQGGLAQIADFRIVGWENDSRKAGDR